MRVLALLVTLNLVFLCNIASLPKDIEHDIHPNKCGIILFLHINKCGGGSVVNWFKKHAPVLYLKQRGQSGDVKRVNESYMLWTEMIPKADLFVSNISHRIGWKVLHLHHYFPGVSYSEKIIQRWESIVEGKGCSFHKTTMLRDPLDRFISNVNFNKPSINHIDTFMYSRRNWLIRYFLFGICGYHNKELRCGYNPKGDFTMTPSLNENYIIEVKEIISEFDSIGFMDSFGGYLENIRLITGWKEDDANEAKNVMIHKSSDYFNLTSKMLTNFLKLNQEDYVFYYTMKNDVLHL